MAAKKREETIVLPALDIRTLKVKIVGTTPLVVHAWSEKAKRMMREKQQKRARLAKDAKNPEEEFQSSRYIVDGKDVFPAIAFKSAIIDSARFTDGVPMTILRGAVFIRGDWVVIDYESCDMREDMVRVGGKGPGTGTADMRYRAEYKNWSATLELDYNASVLQAEQVVNLVRLSGFSIGIGEMRPGKGGQLGRFNVEAAA